MSELVNTRITLRKRPVGEPREDDFGTETESVREPENGEILLKSIWLSLDPYMRGRMNDAKSYAPPIEIGDVITGESVCQIIQSNSPDYEPGDIVVSNFGWQEYAVMPAERRYARKINRDIGPISTALGVIGMPGRTAYFGLLRVGQPKPGETVVVSAASGAVGSVVGQIAKIKGCRAVGIAGGKEKCNYVVNELGFDAAVDYKGGNLEKDLAAACPKGIDVYYENVGGPVLRAVIPLLNNGSRVPICGFVSQYNVADSRKVESPERILDVMPNPPFHRFFLVGEWGKEFPSANEQLAQWVKSGQLKYRESVVEGIENAPRAFIGLLRGENFGKQLIKVADVD